MRTSLELDNVCYATSSIKGNSESIRIITSLGVTNDPLITYTYHESDTKLSSYDTIPTPQTPQENRTFL